MNRKFTINEAGQELMALNKLSTRESEVVEHLVTGNANKVIASDLFVTEKTIKFHLTNIYKKMGAKSRASLIAMMVPYMTPKEQPAPFHQEQQPMSGDALPGGAR